MALQNALEYLHEKFGVDPTFITNILKQITRGKESFIDIVADYENKFNVLKDLITVCIKI